MVSKIVIAGFTAAAVAVAGIGLWAYFRDDGWEKAVEDTDVMLNKHYNDAVHEFPSDGNKAAFSFQMKAAQLREEFTSQWESDERYVEWAKIFDARVKASMHALRKAA